MSVATDADQAFLSAVTRIADEFAAPNADDVDRNARFPTEAFDALKEEQALSAFVPQELGGAVLVAAGTHERNRVWHDDESLWRDVVAKSPNNGRGLMNYGLIFMQRGAAV